MKTFIILGLLFIAQLSYGQYNGTLKDTITTSGSTYSDTRYPLRSGTSVMGATSATLSRMFTIENTLSVIVTATKISGTVAAKVYLDFGNGLTPNTWVAVDSMTLTDVATQSKVFEPSSFKSNKFRMRMEAASSTQSVGLTMDWAVKPE